MRGFDWEKYYNIKSQIDGVEEELEDIKADWMKEDDEEVADEKYGEWIKELEQELYCLRGQLACIY